MHVVAIGSPVGPQISCSCQIYGTLNDALEQSNLNDNLKGLSCCHTRLAQDLFCVVPFPFVPNEEETSIPKSFLNEQKIRKAEKFVETSVLKLPSKTGVVKYSVVAAANNVANVTIFSVKRSQKTVVSCHNTICQMQQGKERTVQNVNNSDNLCPHIKLMKKQKIFEDIPESEGSYELPDHFLEDEIFENLDEWSDKNLPEKVILVISFFSHLVINHRVQI